MINPAAVCGMDESHLVRVAELDCKVHRGVAPALRALARAASAAGFTLGVASAYRGFAHQAAIWNAKARGERPVLDDAGTPLVMPELSPWEQVQAILRWSALPGASRHHWGTDLDIFDRAALPPGYRLQLVPAESEPGGVQEGFHRWLGQVMAGQQAFDFFRPYAQDRGGVVPEPWHVSYRPLARECEQCLTPDVLRHTVERADLELRETVLEHLDEIFARYVQLR